MSKLLAGFAALPLLAGVALAGQPTPLTNTQMDQVTAGLADTFVFPAANVFTVVLYNPPPLLTTPHSITENFPSLDGAVPPGLTGGTGDNIGVTGH